MFKGDTVSEKFNKAENHPGCQICLPKPKCPECLLLIVTRKKKKSTVFFPSQKKENPFPREEKFCFCSGVGSGSEMIG